jgi:hypothetical protein
MYETSFERTHQVLHIYSVKSKIGPRLHRVQNVDYLLMKTYGDLYIKTDVLHLLLLMVPNVILPLSKSNDSTFGP